MNFKAVKDLMNKVRTGYLATTDGKRATVRPMAAHAWFGKELWLATGLASDKVTDIRKRSAVDFCLLDIDMESKGFTMVRIDGRCRVSTAAADKKKLFAAFPWMDAYFGSAGDPNWAVLRMTPKRIRTMTSIEMEYKAVNI